MPTRHSRAIDWLFGLTIALGALLLFLVQPLLGKYILPWFGGSPAVWTTCMLFFQSSLLVGYLYAFILNRYLPPTAQVIVHLALLLGGCAMLPIVPGERWIPQNPDQPVGRILLLLGAVIGLPYVALSATGPLLQSWLGRLRPGPAPYRLFALSNGASLAALLGFPLVIEPAMSRGQSAWWWGVGFVVFAAMSAICCVLSRTARVGPTLHAGAFPIRARTMALLLSCCGSVLLLAVTNKICQDVAVVPLLWVLPLAAYLVTFIMSFDSPRWYHRGIFQALLWCALGAAAWTMLADTRAIGIVGQVVVYLAILLVLCMVSHGELSRLKPTAEHLTGFYLTIAAGGALGGLLVTIGAPLVFRGFYELNLGIIATVILAMLLLWSDPMSKLYRGRNPGGWVAIAIGLVALCTVMVGSGMVVVQGAKSIRRERNFYGVLSILEDDGPIDAGAKRYLVHGGIVHGMQYLDPDRQDIPLSYYAPDSGGGVAMRALPQTRAHRIGVVGLGAGSMAGYLRAGDSMRFYEIDAKVEQLARKYFTYLSNAPGTVDVVLGDARLSLAHEPPQQFDLLVLDAFSGDSIPVHLLTSECFDVYKRHLADGAVIAVHISNHYLDLAPVVRGLAEHSGFRFVQIECPAGPATGRYASTWMLLSKNDTFMDSELVREAAARLEWDGVKRNTFRRVRLWTDDHSSLIEILKLPEQFTETPGAP